MDSMVHFESKDLPLQMKTGAFPVLFKLAPVSDERPTTLTKIQPRTLDNKATLIKGPEFAFPDTFWPDGSVMLNIRATADQDVVFITVVFASGTKIRMPLWVTTADKKGPEIRNFLLLGSNNPVRSVEFYAHESSPVSITEFSVEPERSEHILGTNVVEVPAGAIPPYIDDLGIVVPINQKKGTLRLRFGDTPDAQSGISLGSSNGVDRYAFNNPGTSPYILPLPGTGDAWVRFNWGPRARVPSDTNGVIFSWSLDAIPKFPTPITVPIDIMLNRKTSEFRRSDLELYRWTLFPDVRIIAFNGLDVQDLYFKRIAFFVEKRWFRGSLLKDKELENRHGWNAHDYNAQGIAGFFEAARKAKFPLNRQERELYSWCLSWGLIHDETGTVEPGTGAVLSFAFDKAVTPGVRKILLQHESLHGVFFSLPLLREAGKKRWEQLNPDAKLVMLDFFDASFYDRSWEYLMYNEYVAYLLQQGPDALAGVVRDVWIASAIKHHPEQKARIQASIPAILNAFTVDQKAFASIVKEAKGLDTPFLVELKKQP